MENEAGVVPVLQVRLSGLCYGWDNLRRHPKTASALVPGDVVRNQSEARCQRNGVAATFGLAQLSYGVVVVAQVAARDGAARPG